MQRCLVFLLLVFFSIEKLNIPSAQYNYCIVKKWKKKKKSVLCWLRFFCVCSSQKQPALSCPISGLGGRGWKKKERECCTGDYFMRKNLGDVLNSRYAEDI